MDHRTNSAKILCCSVGEGDELERNPAYQTSASLIPSSSNHESMPAECYKVSYEDEVSSCVVSTDVFTSCSTRWSPGSRSR